MGGKTTSTQKYNQTQTAAPPSWTQQGLQDVASRVTSALGQTPAAAYTGDFVAQPNAALTQQAVNAYTGSAGTAGQLAQTAQGFLPGLQAKAPTSTYDMGQNAELSGVIDAAINPVFRQLTEQVLPGIKSSSLASGAYSGDRAMAVLPGQAIRDASGEAQRLAAQVSYQDYADREARRLAAYQTDQGNALSAYGLETQRTGMLPDIVDTIMRMDASQGDLLAQALGLQTSASQAGIDNALAKDQYDVTSPYRGLDIATQLLTQLSGGYGTTTGSGNSTTTQSTGGLGPVLQGILGAASLAGGLGAFGPVGAALGTASNAAAAPAAIAFSRNRTVPTVAGVFGS